MKYIELREEIADICVRMWQHEWVAANDGNVTVKLDDGTFLATPTGVSKGMMTAEKIIRIDAEGKSLDSESGYRPSSEIKMHLRCYKEREDIRAVVHAHPPAATAYACTGIPLDGYQMTETILTLGSVPIAPYATPSTEEVPDSIAPFLTEHDGILLANHGALTVGENLISAFYHMESLEQYAKISMNIKFLGGAEDLPQDRIEKLIDLRKNYYHTPGKHPGYKKYSK